MRSSDLLIDGFGRIQEDLGPAVRGLSAEQLAYRPAPGANSIAWLAWHLTRVQDDHVAEVAGREQVWTAEGWVDRFGLPFPPSATGFGFTSEQVAQVRGLTAELLLDHAAAVHARTVEFVRGVGDEDLDRVVDERWDPPVTLGVRLISVLSDALQHVGQAAYVRSSLLPS
jgi:uncharacterized damage-inducible protein DinB